MTEQEDRYEWQEVAAYKGRKLYEHVTADDPAAPLFENLTPGERLDWIEVAVDASGLVRNLGVLGGLMRGLTKEVNGLRYDIRKIYRGETG